MINGVRFCFLLGLLLDNVSCIIRWTCMLYGRGLGPGPWIWDSWHRMAKDCFRIAIVDLDHTVETNRRAVPTWNVSWRLEEVLFVR